MSKLLEGVVTQILSSAEQSPKSILSKYQEIIKVRFSIEKSQNSDQKKFG